MDLFSKEFRLGELKLITVNKRNFRQPLEEL